jgi:peptide/nickel transport system ATP-binding protein
MLDLFAAVQLPNPGELARRYPHQLSGGQQQRVSIAAALACDPDLLVLDEPTTGLDVTTEARILDLVESLRQRTAAGILYITHNLGVIARLAQEVAVMYAGEIVEQGPVDTVFARPQHPYTVALLDCLPRVDRPPLARLLPAIEGTLPDPRAEVRACQFAPRCALADARCRAEHPGWFQAAAGHGTRCFYWARVPPPGATRPPSLATAAIGGGAPRVLLLEVAGLVHHYRPVAGIAGLFGRAPVVRAVDGVSLVLGAGETLAVVG